MQNAAASAGIQLLALGQFVISKTDSLLFSDAQISHNGGMVLILILNFD
jgi:hypothetical protein